MKKRFILRKRDIIIISIAGFVVLLFAFIHIYFWIVYDVVKYGPYHHCTVLEYKPKVLFQGKHYVLQEKSIYCLEDQETIKVEEITEKQYFSDMFTDGEFLYIRNGYTLFKLDASFHVIASIKDNLGRYSVTSEQLVGERLYFSPVSSDDRNKRSICYYDLQDMKVVETNISYEEPYILEVYDDQIYFYDALLPLKTLHGYSEWENYDSVIYTVRDWLYPVISLCHEDFGFVDFFVDGRGMVLKQDNEDILIPTSSENVLFGPKVIASENALFFTTSEIEKEEKCDPKVQRPCLNSLKKTTKWKFDKNTREITAVSELHEKSFVFDITATDILYYENGYYYENGTKIESVSLQLVEGEYTRTVDEPCQMGKHYSFFIIGKKLYLYESGNNATE